MGTQRLNTHPLLLVRFLLPLHFAQHKMEGGQAVPREVLHLFLFLGKLPLKYKHEDNNK